MRRALSVALLLCLALSAAGCLKLHKPPEIKDATEVPLTTTWKVDLPEGVTAADVLGVSVRSGETFRPVAVERAGSRLGLTPQFGYARNETVEIRIFLTDGSRVDRSITTEDYPKLEEGKAVEVQAMPALGFYYPYFLFIPEGMPKESVRRLLVEPASTAISDDLIHHIERSRAHLTPKRFSRAISEELKIPVLIPVFPRLVRGPATQDLSRDTLLLDGGPLKRVDLQLLAIIADARKVLAKNGIQIEEKVFLQGYAETGHFTSRFAMLHPELVRAVAAGGVGGTPTLPTESYQGEVLRYPVGLGDLRDLTGAPFNAEAYRQVAQYFQMGELDRGDVTTDRKLYAEEDAARVHALLGAKPMPDRWQRAEAIYKELGMQTQFVTYRNVGQQPGPTADLIAFFRANDNNSGKLTPIVPTQ